MAWRKEFRVNPNQTGCLFFRNQLHTKLQPGIYRYWDWRNEYTLLNISQNIRNAYIKNQEVLTKDNIALRFSMVFLYAVSDLDKLLNYFNIVNALKYNDESYLFGYVEQSLIYMIKLQARDFISNIDSEKLSECRSQISDLLTPEMSQKADQWGIDLLQVLVLDWTFPKVIQELFAKQLEAKIRAKTDLENARTAVATARTLKNASELMKDDANIRFVQFLETWSKVATKGNHTFVLGDWWKQQG